MSFKNSQTVFEKLKSMTKTNNTWAYIDKHIRD